MGRPSGGPNPARAGQDRPAKACSVSGTRSTRIESIRTLRLRGQVDAESGQRAVPVGSDPINSGLAAADDLGVPHAGLGKGIGVLGLRGQVRLRSPRTGGVGRSGRRPSRARRSTARRPGPPRVWLWTTNGPAPIARLDQGALSRPWAGPFGAPRSIPAGSPGRSNVHACKGLRVRRSTEAMNWSRCDCERLGHLRAEPVGPIVVVIVVELVDAAGSPWRLRWPGRTASSTSPAGAPSAISRWARRCASTASHIFCDRRVDT